MQLGENSFDDNKFSIVFDENVHGEELSRMADNSDMDERMGEIDEEDEEYDDEGR